MKVENIYIKDYRIYSKYKIFNTYDHTINFP